MWGGCATRAGGGLFAWIIHTDNDVVAELVLLDSRREREYGTMHCLPEEPIGIGWLLYWRH
jgi:hypothetical protein